jgi:hypothetical protein
MSQVVARSAQDIHGSLSPLVRAAPSLYAEVGVLRRAAATLTVSSCHRPKSPATKRFAHLPIPRQSHSHASGRLTLTARCYHAHALEMARTESANVEHLLLLALLVLLVIVGLMVFFG